MQCVHCSCKIVYHWKELAKAWGLRALGFKLAYIIGNSKDEDWEVGMGNSVEQGL